jgi:hypothetical protein
MHKWYHAHLSMGASFFIMISIAVFRAPGDDDAIRHLPGRFAAADPMNISTPSLLIPGQG